MSQLPVRELKPISNNHLVIKVLMKLKTCYTGDIKATTIPQSTLN